MSRNVEVLSHDIAVDVAVLSGGAVSAHERSVSELRCGVCGAVEVVDGIVAHLVFEHDHRHGEA